MYCAALLKGSALSLYHSLSTGEPTSWDKLKTELLKKFQCSAEGFREKFRSVRPETNECFSAFLIRAGHLLDRWVELSNTSITFDSLRDLFIREQILHSVSTDLAVFLQEREIKTAEDMCRIADQYRSAHPGKNVSRKNNQQIFDANIGFTQQEVDRSQRPRENYSNRGGDKFRGNYSRMCGQQDGRGGYTSYRGQPGYIPYRGQQNRGRINNLGRQRQTGYQARTNRPHCYNCGCMGHMKRECPRVQRANVCECCGVDQVDSCAYREDTQQPDRKSQTSLKEEHTAISVEEDPDLKEGNVFHASPTGLNIESCSVNGFAASLLRDTGCTTAGVKKSLVMSSQYTGKVQRCRTFGGNIESFPLAEIQIHTPYFQGMIEACVINEPVADLILGNLPGVSITAGGKSGSLVCGAEALVSTRSQVKIDSQQKKPMKVPRIEGLEVTTEKLVELQKGDPSLVKCT